MITEKQFATQIEDLFTIYGWKFYHVLEQSHYARRTSKGFPDYVAVRGGRPSRLIFVELKNDIGKLTPEQEEWHKALVSCQKRNLSSNPEVYLWRPSMLEQIVKILK